MTRDDVFAAILDERQRQHDEFGGLHSWGVGDCSSRGVTDQVKAMVLTEECGEVARAVLDRQPANLRTELIQVAAVAVAWLEGIA